VQAESAQAAPTLPAPHRPPYLSATATHVRQAGAWRTT
jgi:hypothetical protein